MKNKKLIALLIAVLLIYSMLCACARESLPEDAVDFTTTEYINPDDAEDGYAGVVEYNGRQYVLYGVQSGTVKLSRIGECIGYCDGDANARVYSLDETGDYLAEFYANGMMEQVTFLRALDTAGKEIYTPDYIDSLGFELWN